jgi:hypothetical protein
MDDPSAGLMQIAENMTRFIELADGERKKLEARGWSPTAAETYALELLVQCVRLSFRPPEKLGTIPLGRPDEP